MRRIALALTFAALVPVAVATMAADAAKRSRCQRLAGRDLAPARTVKLVRVPNPDANGNDLLGCVLPGGAVVRVASSSDRETAGEWYDISQVNGRTVLVDDHFGSQYGSGTSTRVWDLRSGRAYTIAGYNTESGDPASGSQALTAYVTKAGRAVAAISAGATGDVSIAGFAANGTRRDFDRGSLAAVDPGSLALRGNLVSWRHDGKPLTADLKTAG